MDQQNPTPAGGASTPSDPIDRIEAYLAAQDGGDSNEQTTDDAQAGAGGEQNSAAKPTDKPEDGEPGENKEPQFTTAHLAQFLGIDESMIDVDEAGQPVFKTKIDGKEGAAKFQDFLKDHQLKGAAENRVREAAEREKAAERKLQEADQAIQAQYQHAMQVLQTADQRLALAQQEIDYDKSQINWQELWATDPGRAGQLRDYYEARMARIQKAHYENAQQQQAMAQQAEQRRAQAALQMRATQSRALLEMVPEWKDSAVMQKEGGAVREWALGRGYDPAFLDAVNAGVMPNAAAFVRDLRSAWQHDTLQKSKPEIENKLRAAPKLAKPGQPANQGENKAADLRALKQKARMPGRAGNDAIDAWLIASGAASTQ
jgi:hypothetical protein